MLVLVGILLICGFSQCNNSSIYLHEIKFENSLWAKDNPVKFRCNVTDTTKLYDVVLELTNNDDYPLANLYMFTNIILPNNTYYRDTIEFILSDQKGEWTGKGTFSYTNTFIFQKGIKFPNTGTYIFVFEQAMRCRNTECSLNGLESIAINIQKK